MYSVAGSLTLGCAQIDISFFSHEKAAHQVLNCTNVVEIET